MDSAPTAAGGIELHRGMEHERAGIIFHLLIRLRHYSSARVTIETYEDATIAWSDPARGDLFEDIQCKKLEDPSKGVQSLGMGDWCPGQLTRGTLKTWLEEMRRGESSTGRLAKNPGRFFTLLAYAEPANTIKKFIPPGVVAGGYTHSAATKDYFPPDFVFLADPDQYSTFGSSLERCRIRIVPLGPPQYHNFIAILLDKLYGVSTSKTLDAFHAIENLLYGHLPRAPEARTFTLTNIEAAIKPYRRDGGKWIDMRALIAAERNLGEERVRAVPFVHWSDFETERFIKTELIRAGAAEIARQDYIVVAGYNGCGKTVLCKYLAHTFLASNPGAQCFYLQATPGDDLREELDIFQAKISQPALFIIDDAQFAEEGVKAIAQAYVDLLLTKAPAAKLVIATTETSYSRARMQSGMDPLDKAHLLRSEFLSADVLRQLLKEFHAYRPGGDAAADSGIVSIAGGDDDRANLGVALILAHSADPQVLRASQALSLESEQVRNAVARWLASVLQLTPEEFNEHLASVFTVCSFGLLVAPDFGKFTDRLVAAGFMVETHDGATPVLRVRPEYASLAWIISRQNLASHEQIFLRYAQTHKTQNSRLAASLSSDDSGRPTLEFLLRSHLDLFVPEGDTRNLDFMALATTIASISRVRRRAASDFVRRCFRDGDAGGSRMISFQGSVYAALSTDVRPLIAFLNATYRADRVLAQDLGAKLIDNEGDQYDLTKMVRESPCGLEDVLRFLAAAKNCDIRFGTKLAPALAQDELYESKWRKVAGSDDPVPVVRALGELQSVNRRMFSDAKSTYLTDDTTLRWIGKVRDIAAFVDFLSGVRRLSPRISSQALKLLVERYKGRITALIAGADGISDSSLALASIARIDRRVAIRFARENFDTLSKQVAAEKSYNTLGECLTRLRRATTGALAERLAAYISVHWIADSFQRERLRFDLVGRTLDRLADVAPDIAAQIAGLLDYGVLYSKISKQRLMNYSQLTRGLHIALPPEKREQLLSYVRGTPDLSAAFHRALFNERSLHQVADALSTLASAGLPAREIIRLFGSGEAGFLDWIRKRMSTRESSYSDLEIANFLFAVAQLDPAYAAEALASHIDAGDGPTSQALSAKSVESRFATRRAGRFGDERLRPAYIDLAGTGALLHISSSIDDEAARALLESRLPSLGRAGADKNLGRHAMLLLAINNVSRTACLQFTKNLYTTEYVETLAEVTRNPHELIQLLYSAQVVSVGECRRMGSGLVAGAAESLHEYLLAEVDLSELSRWAMTLAAIGQRGSLNVEELATECAEYDTRLWALIDAAQGMIAAELASAGTIFASKILENIGQVKSTRKLGHCVQLWLKTSYIARALDRPQLIARFTEAMLPRALELFAVESDHLCAAFAIRLWLDCGLATPSQTDELGKYREFQLKRVLVASSTVQSVLVASLLRLPKNQIAVLMSKIALDGLPIWVTGLLQIILDGYVDDSLRVTGHALALDFDQNNLKFGLACYAQRRALGSVSEAAAVELASRNLDESSSAIRALLDTTFSAGRLPENPYYVWVYLRRTLLSLNYLDWDSEIHRANSAAVFRKSSSIDPSPILNAAE